MVTADDRDSVRLEKWTDDFASLSAASAAGAVVRVASASANVAVSRNAAAWLDQHSPTKVIHGAARQDSPANTAIASASAMCATDAAGQHVYSLDAVLRANALRYMDRPYVRRFLCEDQRLDFECLGYDLLADYCETTRIRSRSAGNESRSSSSSSRRRRGRRRTNLRAR